ncbi:hypothetical protein A33M_0722 [Rhodovulum sp. PH10]|nr:hypothetical protein A33M_0722 [Rhodovulum sp. PH10]
MCGRGAGGGAGETHRGRRRRGRGGGGVGCGRIEPRRGRRNKRSLHRIGGGCGTCGDQRREHGAGQNRECGEAVASRLRHERPPIVVLSGDFSSDLSGEGRPRPVPLLCPKRPSTKCKRESNRAEGQIGRKESIRMAES